MWDPRRLQGQPGVLSRYARRPRMLNESKGLLNLSLQTLSRLHHPRLRRIRDELGTLRGTIIPREVRRDEATEAES